jgi:hypothetical protein
MTLVILTLVFVVLPQVFLINDGKVQQAYKLSMQYIFTHNGNYTYISKQCFLFGDAIAE